MFDCYIKMQQLPDEVKRANKIKVEYSVIGGYCVLMEITYFDDKKANVITLATKDLSVISDMKTLNEFVTELITESRIRRKIL
jgi:hypothetical protein